MLKKIVEDDYIMQETQRDEEEEDESQALDNELVAGEYMSMISSSVKRKQTLITEPEAIMDT